VIGKSLGLSYPKSWLDIMWKMMFDAHAHDSIGGCNSDETNQDIILRLTKVNRIADDLLNILKKQITYAVSKSIGKENIILVFNTKASAEKENIEGVIFSSAPVFTIETINGDSIAFDVVSQSCLSGGKKIVVTAEGEKEIELPEYYRTVINMKVDNIPPMGYATFIVNESAVSKERRNMVLEKEDNKISNDHYDIICEKNKLTLIYKKSTQKLENFISFEDVGDAGDSYDFSPLEGEEQAIIERAEVVKVEKGFLVEKMTVVHKVLLPKDLEERINNGKSLELEIATVFELRKGEKFIRVNHIVNNEVKDHRLRVLFKTTIINPKCSYADQGFSVLTRPVKNSHLNNWRENKFAEAPVPIYPLENFAAISEENETFALITKGIKEYEVLDTGELALTLFRSVGLLGKDNLLWRPGRESGINNKVIYTPDAELQKELEFEYAIYLEDKQINPEVLFRVTEKYIKHYAFYQKQSLNTFEERLERFEIPIKLENLPDSYSLLMVDNPKVFMSACKHSYEGDGVILRLFNPSNVSEPTAVFGKGIGKIVVTNLYEDEKEEVKDRIVIPPKGYVTLKIKVVRGESNEKRKTYENN
jgi:alpha-mannosidase